MAPRKPDEPHFDPDQDTIRIAPNVWMPLSIFGGAIVMAVSITTATVNVNSRLAAIEKSMVTKHQLREYNYELYISNQEVKLKTPPLEEIFRTLENQ